MSKVSDYKASLHTPPASGNKSIYYRLIALWVLNEALLGGIIHGFKLPVSGLIVGGCAVVCICLIAWYVPVKGAIIKATIIVAIFKMMLSPQAPLPAYIAVFFQGLMGELIFWNRKFFRLSCILFAVLALIESGLQRILMLTIVYGNDLWKVINDFINGLTKQKVSANYSLIIGSGYVGLHLIAGLLAGWWASLLPARIAKWNKEEVNKVVVHKNAVATLPVKSNRKRRLKTGLFIAWIILVLLYAQSYFQIGKALLPAHVSLKILLRSLIIVLSWYFIVGPLLKQLLHYWLRKKKTQSQQDIQQVLQLLPATQELISTSWRLAGNKKGWNRMTACGKMILVNALSSRFALQDIKETKVFILTGPVKTGKTTSLVNWSQKRDDVFGILTPRVTIGATGSSGRVKRVFMNAHTREQFPMEADPSATETEVLAIGRFVFSKASFNKAEQVIRDARNKKGWLVIDEIGPLELKEKGFYGVLKEVLQNRQTGQKILLVVREGMVNKVKKFFQLKIFVLINDISSLKD